MATYTRSETPFLDVDGVFGRRRHSLCSRYYSPTSRLFFVLGFNGFVFGSSLYDGSSLRQFRSVREGTIFASPAGSDLTGSASYWDTHSLSAASATTLFHRDSTTPATCYGLQSVNIWVSTADLYPYEPEPHQSELSLSSPSPTPLTHRCASPTVVLFSC
ncbi:hypothetical protein DY000_02037235 [Brassica cretica]|uniref:Legume lectin domain-containing protein n=1 Tax=Brassica cretica TaxID=69181 RepID=A0ABQ7BLV9_BRACR|nr:hypothetical protein DY000_02037235 [Brassica cretica]